MAKRSSGLPSSEEAEVARRRRGRNIAMLLILLALALLFYAIAMVKMAHHGLSG
jgi:hypothetical protein